MLNCYYFEHNCAFMYTVLYLSAEEQHLEVLNTIRVGEMHISSGKPRVHMTPVGIFIWCSSFYNTNYLYFSQICFL